MARGETHDVETADPTGSDAGPRTGARGAVKSTGSARIPQARPQSDAPPEAGTGHGLPLLRTAGAIAYAPVAVTEQLLSRSRPLWYYAGVAALAGAGAIDWPVAGVVIAGVWVARRRPSGGGPHSETTGS